MLLAPRGASISLRAKDLNVLNPKGPDNPACIWVFQAGQSVHEPIGWRMELRNLKVKIRPET